MVFLESAHYERVVAQFNQDRRTTRLREATYRAIKRLILRGIVDPYVPLAEERLAAILGVSRTPVREALAILEHEGLLTAVIYKGLFVADLSVSDFVQMYETLELVEPELARRAAVNATEADLARMEQALIDAERTIPDNPASHLDQCAEFQRILGACAGNTYMTALVARIEERSDLYLITKWRTLPADKMLAAVADRRRILDAV
ncbi:MAG: GntR family transcriptional regulator, partial [Anaerolineae bacterium]|nr:GntR family transcriptional regulator [Anaerolineae bacterium]